MTTLLNRTSRSVRLTAARFCTPVSCCQAARPGSLASGLQDTSFQYITKCVVDIRKVRAPRQKHHRCMRQTLFRHESGDCAPRTVQVLEGNHGLQERCLRCGTHRPYSGTHRFFWASRLKALSRLGTTVIEIQGTAEGVVAGSVCVGFKADARRLPLAERDLWIAANLHLPALGAELNVFTQEHIKKSVKVKGPCKGPH